MELDLGLVLIRLALGPMLVVSLDALLDLDTTGVGWAAGVVVGGAAAAVLLLVACCRPAIPDIPQP